MLDWRDHGAAYGDKMISLARALATALADQGLPVFAADRGYTASHQFAILAAEFGGGQAASKTLRRAGFLTCGIGLPADPVPGDMNGLRIGTPELVRWGVDESDAPRMAKLIASALRCDDPGTLAEEVAQWRRSFNTLHYIRD
jgi:glycine hydroxymethyltransferase